jgi:flagellar basal-body rod protein FlgG
MMRSLSIAATGMLAQETKMNVVANNLANASTTGFKRARAEFADLLTEKLASAEAPREDGGSRPAPLESGLGVRVASTTRSFGAGDMISTGNPLDVAIEGNGFIQVRTPDGELAYTRAGNLRLDGDGRLVTQGGFLVEPGITVPADATQMTIDREGRVLATVPGRDEPLELGTLELAMFANPGGLESLGDTLLKATPGSGAPIIATAGTEGAGTFSQGFLEGANVKTVEEMIDLITTQRSYEMSSKVIQSADQMLQRLSSLR